jgi:diaminopimelate epimerase
MQGKSWAGHKATSMRVVKMHGARNDFVIVDTRRDAVDNPSALARSLCDRRGGIGADGLLLVEPSAAGAARMRIVNADGSEAEMCGNGIRCFARYLDEEAEGDALAIETASGVLATRVLAREPEYRVRVSLCHPERARHPERSATHIIRVGNPHLVLIRDSVDDVDLETVAREVQRDFPEGINVHVASVVDERTLRARHWERGVGQTQACGTGSAACAVAAIEDDLVRSPVDVIVPGGTLTIEWDGDRLDLIGPAERVFETTVNAT